MRKSIYFLITIITILLIDGCEEDTFIPNREPDAFEKPNNLTYVEVINAREFSLVKSGVPHLNTGGLIPTYEIISGEDAGGSMLGESFMSSVSISNAIINDSIPSRINYSKAGIITIANGNLFSPGNYFFTVKATTSNNDKTYSNTFENVFHLGMGPQLVKNLLYSPIAQNLVVGTGNTTAQPYIITGNTDVVFSLGSDEDKLQIDLRVGIISLVDGYSTVENDTIYPEVVVTSNISGETTKFKGDGFLVLVASNDPVVLPKKTNYFFYPTLQAENTIYGYRKDVIELGSVKASATWGQGSPSPLASSERPESIVGNKSLTLNATTGDKLPHESDLIINSQNLSIFKTGYDISTVFYIKNQYVEYLPDGRTPVDLEIYISTDYSGDNDVATWTQINDQISCQINSLTSTPFIGTPYPGDQKKIDPDGRKDSSRNADGKWVRCEFNLNDYKQEENFTIKFKFKSYYTGSIKALGRPGRFTVSDVHFKATEE